MAKGVDFTCPECGKKNFVTFSEIKKNMKSGTLMSFPCGCNFSPQKVLDQLAREVTSLLMKANPKLSK
jgi:transcription elongation factor Elf1